MKAILIKFLPKSLRFYIKDRIDGFNRLWSRPLMSLEKHSLSETQVYPSGKSFDKCIELAIKKETSYPFLSKEDKIISMGSCFAEEIAHYLKDSGYNYLQLEKNRFDASANWGRIYTTANLYQVIKYSIQNSFPVLVAKAQEGSFFDPLRDASVGNYKSEVELQDETLKHRKYSLLAFKEANILTITIGQNEAWVEQESQIVWAQKPVSPEKFECKQFSLEENISYLSKSLEMLKECNKELKIILTLSPVSSFATFLSENIISQSLYNKCLLRVAIEEVVKKYSYVFYFPSYEIVNAYNPSSYRVDNRHVKHGTVKRIMNIFKAVVLR